MNAADVSVTNNDNDVADIILTMVDELAKDADGDGVASPGDTLKYRARLYNAGYGVASGVKFFDTPDNNTRLVIGTVTTLQGTILKGMFPGDNSVEISIGTMVGHSEVMVTFEVTINKPLWVPDISNQATVKGANFTDVVSDDPVTPGDGDATLTSIKTSPPVHGPAMDEWGTMALITLLGVALVWVMRRRQVRSEIN
jgi:uncharacterized repeat protein (TIGR01451 family)